MKIKTNSIKTKVKINNNLNDTIVSSIQDIKGKKIILMDLRKIDEAPTDYFIICEGDSTTQIKAISDSIQKKVFEELQIKPNHREGLTESKWVLVDYFNTIVHVFYPETRKYYDLEDLWSDSKFEYFEDM
ncbi:MAG: ribosome silencing factor [Saprospiraceae bacterium]